MPSPIPTRNRRVYFVGAGLSVALGLPNTPSLIQDVLILASQHARWGKRERLPDRLREAFEYFYPDAVNEGYQPDVVDFFSSLRTYLDVGAGLAGGFHEAPDLYRTLKFAIAHLLIQRIRDCDAALRSGHPYLTEMVAPGNIVITSNWDLVVERYAQIHGVPLRLTGSGEHEVALLKLHGSLDWLLGRDRRYPPSNYSVLGEQLFAPHPHRMKLPTDAQLRQTIIRIRALETWSSAWQRVSSRATELYMVTMARGKAGDLGPLLPIWRDAYGAVSRAAHLEITGYSMPPDDIEIRTLLRAGILRGKGPRDLVVRNPTPEVHERVRRYLRHDALTDYRGIPQL